MKSLSSILLIIVILLILCSCKNSIGLETSLPTTNVAVIEDVTLSTETLCATPTITSEPTPTATFDPNWFPCPNDNYRNEDGSLKDDFMQVEYDIKSNQVTYINNDLGFSLEIPKEWINYLYISEYSDGVSFSFFGKSIVGQGWFYFIEPTIGIYMYSIFSKDVVDNNKYELDVIGYVGAAREVDYYITSSLDVSISIIERQAEEAKNGTSYFKSDEEELTAIISDNEIAMDMYENFSKVFDTFKEIP